MKKILFSIYSIALLTLTSCSSNVKVGDYARGGIVAWIDWKGEHGIVCATNDLDKGYNWDDAERKCSELIIKGKDDWYLPSKSELHKLYLNLHKKGLGNFNANYNYWSSTENTTSSRIIPNSGRRIISSPYYFSFNNDCSYFYQKSMNDIYLVRAVRAF
jgi:hypothetical protein